MNKYVLKFLSVLIISTLILGIMDVDANAAEAHNWYIKRNGTGTPSFPPDAEMLKEYNCYFIDDKAISDTDLRRIYITFDAGYENGNVEKIMDVLKAENVPAAFFLLDNIILKNTDLVKRMAEEGHLVCNHTKNHKNLCGCTEEEIARDISALENIYQEKTDRQMSKYFRFPEGKYSMEAVKIINSLGYKTIFWSFAYDDWDNNRQSDPERAIKKVLDNTHDGAIMLFHPTSATNAKIFPMLIKEWRKMGYSFGTLDELTS